MKENTEKSPRANISLALSAANWALPKVGYVYSQAKRTQENIFDCSFTEIEYITYL